MLKNLFISKVRIRLLEKLLLNQDGEYHVRGLVREMNEEINAIRRELINLKDAGILTSEPKGNKIVYKVNPKCPIIPDLVSMLYKSSEFGINLISIGSKIGNTEIIIIAKPFLVKKYESTQDVDLLFVGDIDIKKATGEMKELEKVVEREIRFSVLSLKDFEFAKKKREPFLVNILDNEKIIMLGSEKVLAV